MLHTVIEFLLNLENMAQGLNCQDHFNDLSITNAISSFGTRGGVTPNACFRSNLMHWMKNMQTLKVSHGLET